MQLLGAEHNLAATAVRFQIEIELWRPPAGWLQPFNMCGRIGYPPIVVRNIQLVGYLQPLSARYGLQATRFHRL